MMLKGRDPQILGPCLLSIGKAYIFMKFIAGF